MQKLVLEYDLDFALFGISCHEQAYRLCWQLNRELGMNLERADEDISFLHKEEESFHPLYTYETEDMTWFSLVKNRSERGVLIPELPHIDYFLKVEDLLEDEDELRNKIRGLRFVNAVYSIDVEQLKSKENLIFD